MKTDNHTESCGDCKHFWGGGDWGLCCPHIKYLDLVGENTEANTHCDHKFERKEKTDETD